MFCGRGGEASDNFLCRTLTQSPAVPALSRREPWFEHSLCVVRTRGVCAYWLFSRDGRPVPYGRSYIRCITRVVRTYTVGADSISARFVRIRIICGYRMLFTGGKTDYTEQTDNCPWQLSAGISNKLQTQITSRNAPPLPYRRSVHSVSDRGVCGCCLSRTIPPSAFGSHRLAAARSHSGSTLPSCRFATFTQGRHG